jgi:hypothetical protein
MSFFTANDGCIIPNYLYSRQFGPAIAATDQDLAIDCIIDGLASWPLRSQFTPISNALIEG